MKYVGQAFDPKDNEELARLRAEYSMLQKQIDAALACDWSDPSRLAEAFERFSNAETALLLVLARIADIEGP